MFRLLRLNHGGDGVGLSLSFSSYILPLPKVVELDSLLICLQFTVGWSIAENAEKITNMEIDPNFVDFLS